MAYQNKCVKTVLIFSMDASCSEKCVRKLTKGSLKWVSRKVRFLNKTSLEDISFSQFQPVFHIFYFTTEDKLLQYHYYFKCKSLYYLITLVTAELIFIKFGKCVSGDNFKPTFDPGPPHNKAILIYVFCDIYFKLWKLSNLFQNWMSNLL